MEIETYHSQGNGESFVAGAGVAGVVALLHNAEKNKRHQHELQQVYLQGHWDGIQQEHRQMIQALSVKDAEIHHLNDLLQLKDSEIARVNEIVENQAKALAWQQLQMTAKIFPSDGDGNVDGQLN